jgi:hypothetical protein
MLVSSDLKRTVGMKGRRLCWVTEGAAMGNELVFDVLAGEPGSRRAIQDSGVRQGGWSIERGNSSEMLWWRLEGCLFLGLGIRIEGRSCCRCSCSMLQG